MSKMISFYLATTSKRSNAQEGAFFQSSGMLLIATSRYALTLGRVDGTLQNAQRTVHLWHQEVVEGTFWQGSGYTVRSGCIHGELRKEVADSRGYVPTQASTSARRSWPSWVSRSGYWHGGHLTMDNMAKYFVAEENIWGAERGIVSLVSPSSQSTWWSWFVSGFFVVCCVGCVLLWVFLWVLVPVLAFASSPGWF